MENFNHQLTQPRNQTLIAAISPEKVFDPLCLEGSLESDKIMQCLQQCRPHLQENQVLFLDNAQPHHRRKVREYLADYPVVILFFAAVSTAD